MMRWFLGKMLLLAVLTAIFVVMDQLLVSDF